MKYLFLLARRLLLTLQCRMSAFFALRTKRAWALSWLDSSIASLQRTLAREAMYCMGKVTRWQKKAGNCVAYHHKAETLLNGGGKKAEKKEKSGGKKTT